MARKKTLTDVVREYLQAERALFEEVSALRFDSRPGVRSAAWALWGVMTANDLRPLLRFLLEALGESPDLL